MPELEELALPLGTAAGSGRMAASRALMRPSGLQWSRGGLDHHGGQFLTAYVAGV